ncbi:hypothetical protein [Papillibacter cinnamivorans]|uniref:Double zinc ribbon n=1 Tax=Papillibacter cinnamivorans DSM 12816 TaxID=1122930 RepID=A0A1W2CL76_9FIRM|nr:hypothetical protein [Papillibacter cinnamivorans]SMC85642.1 hypothetical protein SAMN02745168_0048 [Papillibacter cinnamivorans DSM 12816]
MNKQLLCLRCSETMRYVKNEKLQLGQAGWILGTLPNLLSGAMEVAVYVCPVCGKIELFQSQSDNCSEGIAQKKCPVCGKSHDLDDPVCPFCRHKYYE